MILVLLIQTLLPLILILVLLMPILLPLILSLVLLITLSVRRLKQIENPRKKLQH